MAPEAPALIVPLVVPDVPILKPGVPYRLAVCGEPITRKDYYTKLAGMPAFRISHCSDVRHTMDRVRQLVGDNIDEMIVKSTYPLMPTFMQAECAFTVLAWYTFFDPFNHPKRKFIFRSNFLLPVIGKNADALYKYGVFIKQLPDEEIHDQLKKMHVNTARQYFDYCSSVTVARMEGVDLSWITPW